MRSKRPIDLALVLLGTALLGAALLPWLGCSQKSAEVAAAPSPAPTGRSAPIPADVERIADLFSKRKLAYLLNEPKVPMQRKEAAIRQALASKVLPTSLNLALLVVQRELVEAMPNIARELKQMVLDYKNEAVAEVTTAALNPLSPMATGSETAAIRAPICAALLAVFHW